MQRPCGIKKDDILTFFLGHLILVQLYIKSVNNTNIDFRLIQTIHAKLMEIIGEPPVSYNDGLYRPQRGDIFDNKIVFI